jgi:hypothetical protein
MWNADKAIQKHLGIMVGTLDHPELFHPEKLSGNPPATEVSSDRFFEPYAVAC